jgi:hypothetical protein
LVVVAGWYPTVWFMERVTMLTVQSTWLIWVGLVE